MFKNRLGKRNRTDYIVLHHAAAGKCTIQDIHRWHLERGWAGCGYHYFVAKNGDVCRGRPLDTEGAHVFSYNFCSVGVCAEGDYEKEKMPDEQKNAIIALLMGLKKIYPQAKIVGHRDLNATSCPGRYYPFDEVVGQAKEEEKTPAWKEDVIQKGMALGLLNQYHNPNDVAEKWFVVALANRLQEEINKIKG